MIETLGPRQRALLRALLDHKAGLTIDELAGQLGITRNAVRQHLTGLERDRLVEVLGSRPSGGRPEQLYGLSDPGRELFPRHYAWFAQLLIEAMCQEEGPERLGERLEALGRQVGRQLREREPAHTPDALRIAGLVRHMADLGYCAHAVPTSDATVAPGEAAALAPDVAAHNCIFHHLAERYPQVCRFDLGFMAAYAGTTVEHQECMVRGGGCCRFRFGRGRGGAPA